MIAKINPIVESASLGAETTAGQDILAARIARGDIIEEGLIFTLRGYNK